MLLPERVRVCALMVRAIEKIFLKIAIRDTITSRLVEVSALASFAHMLQIIEMH